MNLNLHDVLTGAVSSLPFSCTVHTDRLDFIGVSAYTSPILAEGLVTDEAGYLSLTGEINADMLCVCGRCATEFPLHKTVLLKVPLATELEDEENPDYYLINGQELDLDDLLESSFILDMETQFLCREDCKGLCPRCGRNLNLGSCGCKKEKDPRLAVLEQLLDDKE